MPRLLVLAELAHVLLAVEFDADLRYQRDLRLEEVDMLLLVVHQLLEQVAGDVVAHAVAVRGGFFVERAGGDLGLEIAVEDFLHVLPDVQRIEHLHVGEAVQEDDAIHELVGVLHLLDRFLPLELGELVDAPMVEQAIVQQRHVLDGYRDGQNVGLILDEWGVWDRIPPDDEKRYGKLWQQSTIRSAVAAGLGLTITYSFYGICAVISFFLVQKFIHETKGKELEDMQG